MAPQKQELKSKKSVVSAAVDHLSKSETTSNPLTKHEQVLVDEFAMLSAKVAEFKETLSQYEKLKKSVASIANDEERYPDAKATVVLRGKTGIVEFSSAADEREITDKNGLIGALKSKLGYDGLLEIIKVGLGDMDKYLTESEASKFFKYVVGNRSLRSVQTK